MKKPESLPNKRKMPHKAQSILTEIQETNTLFSQNTLRLFGIVIPTNNLSEYVIFSPVIAIFSLQSRVPICLDVVERGNPFC